MSLESAKRSISSTNRSSKGWQLLSPGIWFVLPALLVIIALLIYPLLDSFYLSFTNTSIVKTEHSFIGLENYISLFTSDSAFRNALMNSLLLTVTFVPASVFASLILGVAVYENMGNRAVSFLELVIFSPTGVGLTFAMLMWLWIFDQYGWLNYTLYTAFNIEPLNVLSSSTSTILTASLVTFWKHLGFNMLFVLAGLSRIPRSIVEAAVIDGAGWWQSLFRVILPNLRESMAIVTVTSIIAALKAYEQVWAISRGGGNIDVLYTYMYKTSFLYFNLGKGAAIAYIMAFLILAMSALSLLRTRGYRG